MGVSQIELMELQELSLAEFLSSVFGTNEPLKSITGSKKSIFTQIGIYRYVCVCYMYMCLLTYMYLYVLTYMYLCVNVHVLVCVNLHVLVRMC